MPFWKTFYRHLADIFSSKVTYWLQNQYFMDQAGVKWLAQGNNCNRALSNSSVSGPLFKPVTLNSVQTSKFCIFSPFDSIAQRSAHELPMVEKQDMDGCSVLGGQQMILTGQNFSADSKVIFMEKTHGKC